MRPLTVIPRHPISELALSPDGQRLGVAQATQGFRLLDALTGTEIARDIGRENVTETSPTGRHSLYADRMAVRLAEVAAGRPFLRFQTGWTAAGPINRPPDAPGTSALHSAGTTVGAVIDNHAAGGWFRPPAPPPGRWNYLLDAALTADHRIAVGRLTSTETRQVWDLATGAVAANLDFSAERAPLGSVRIGFTPDETRVVAMTARALFVFDLLPPADLAPAARAPAGLLGPHPVGPVVAPTAVIRVTQPQPQPGLPPFALLPCGQKALVRGEKSRVELRDLATGEVLTVWKWGLRRLHALTVAADGLTAAAAGVHGEVVIWDLA